MIFRCQNNFVTPFFLFFLIFIICPVGNGWNCLLAFFGLLTPRRENSWSCVSGHVSRAVSKSFHPSVWAACPLNWFLGNAWKHCGDCDTDKQSNLFIFPFPPPSLKSIQKCEDEFILFLFVCVRACVAVGGCWKPAVAQGDSANLLWVESFRRCVNALRCLLLHDVNSYPNYFCLFWSVLIKNVNCMAQKNDGSLCTLVWKIVVQKVTKCFLRSCKLK